jgi:hypothetical protein
VKSTAVHTIAANYKGSTPVGVFVVKMNGQWVEVSESVGVKRLTQR